jgi:hypothetical protein
LCVFERINTCGIEAIDFVLNIIVCKLNIIGLNFD